MLLEICYDSCVIIHSVVPFRNADHWHGVRDLFIALLNGPDQSFGNFPVEFDAAITYITAYVDHT